MATGGAPLPPAASYAALEEEWSSFGWSEVAHPKEVLQFDFAFSKLNAVLVAIGRALRKNNITFEQLAHTVDGCAGKGDLDKLRETVVVLGRDTETKLGERATRDEVAELRDRVNAQESKLQEVEKAHADELKALADRLAGLEKAQKDAEDQLASLREAGPAAPVVAAAPAAAPAAAAAAASAPPAASGVDGERLAKVERKVEELKNGVAALASKKALDEESRALNAALDELRGQIAKLPGAKELERLRGLAEAAAPMVDLRRSEEDAGRKFASKADLARLQDALAALAAARPVEGGGAGGEVAALVAASAGPGPAELLGRLEDGLAGCAKLADLDALRAALAALQADAARADQRMGELGAADDRLRADLAALRALVADLEARPVAALTPRPPADHAPPPAPVQAAPAAVVAAAAAPAALPSLGLGLHDLEGIAAIEAALLETGAALARLQAEAAAGPEAAGGSQRRAAAARLLARVASIEGDIAARSAAAASLEAAAAAAPAAGDGLAPLAAVGPQLAASRLRHCGVHAAILRAALEGLQSGAGGAAAAAAGPSMADLAEALEKLRKRLRELETRLAEVEAGSLAPLPTAVEPDTARVASPKTSGGSGANAATALEAARPASRGGAAALRMVNAVRGEVEELAGRLEALAAAVRGLQAGQERTGARLDAECEQRAADVAALRKALDQLASRLSKGDAARPAAAPAAPAAAGAGGAHDRDLLARLEALAARISALESSSRSDGGGGHAGGHGGHSLAAPAVHAAEPSPRAPEATTPANASLEELARAVARLEHSKADTAMFRKCAGDIAELRAALEALRAQLRSEVEALAARTDVEAVQGSLEALRGALQGQIDRKPGHEELRELRELLARLEEQFGRLQGEVREDSEARRRAIKEALDRLRRHLEDKIRTLHDNLTRTDEGDYTRAGRVHYRCLGCDRTVPRMKGVPVEHVVHDALPFRPPTVPALLYDHASNRPLIGPPPGATMGGPPQSASAGALALAGGASMLATTTNSTASLDGSPMKPGRASPGGASPAARSPGGGQSPKGVA